MADVSLRYGALNCSKFIRRKLAEFAVDGASFAATPILIASVKLRAAALTPNLGEIVELWPYLRILKARSSAQK